MKIAKYISVFFLGVVSVIVAEYISYYSAYSISYRDQVIASHAALRFGYANPSKKLAKMCSKYMELDEKGRQDLVSHDGYHLLECELLTVPFYLSGSVPEVNNPLILELNRDSKIEFKDSGQCPAKNCNELRYDVFYVLPVIAIVSVSAGRSSSQYLILKVGNSAYCIGDRGLMV